MKEEEMKQFMQEHYDDFDELPLVKQLKEEERLRTLQELNLLILAHEGVNTFDLNDIHIFIKTQIHKIENKETDDGNN